MYIFANETIQQVPWNKGKLIGQKPPLQPKHVWAIRTKLHLDGCIRDGFRRLGSGVSMATGPCAPTVAGRARPGPLTDRGAVPILRGNIGGA